LVFENQQVSHQIAAIKSLLSINQRVNLAIGTAKKIERESRSKKREKRLSTVRSPSGRMAVRPLFATKASIGGGVSKRLLDDQHFLAGFWPGQRRVQNAFFSRSSSI
jgi:hypothetical protein